jgi:predicted ribosome quality control (RQC) complex YloA/Tae2 family protein
MKSRRAIEPAAPSDPDAGVYCGRSVARRFRSPDGFTVLVGRTAADNDVLTFELAAPNDFWFHAAGSSGAHVVVRNPTGVERLPRETLRFAAALAAGHSGARHGGTVAVHVTTRAEIRKPPRAPAGTVTLLHHRTVRAAPERAPAARGAAAAADEA